MSIKFSLTVKGEGEILGNLSRLKLLSVVSLKELVAATAFNIQKAARENVASDVGRLRSSIRIIFDNRGHSASVGTDVDYARYIEFGTGPAGRNARYFPPPGVLLSWMRRHGIPSVAEFAIRLKIFRKGTEAQPFLFLAWERERPKFIKALRKIMKKNIKKSSKG